MALFLEAPCSTCHVSLHRMSCVVDRVLATADSWKQKHRSGDRERTREEGCSRLFIPGLVRFQDDNRYSASSSVCFSGTARPATGISPSPANLCSLGLCRFISCMIPCHVTQAHVWCMSMIFSTGLASVEMLILVNITK